MLGEKQSKCSADSSGPVLDGDALYPHKRTSLQKEVLLDLVSLLQCALDGATLEEFFETTVGVQYAT